jgi:hypothetical protein
MSTPLGKITCDSVPLYPRQCIQLTGMVQLLCYIQGTYHCEMNHNHQDPIPRHNGRNDL